MGFLFHAIKIRIPRAITAAFFFFSTWSHLRLLIIGALTHLGLYKPPPEEERDSGDNTNNYIFILDGTCPSPVPIPIHVVTAAIKKRVPVVRFQDLRPRRKILSTDANEEARDILASEEISENMCTICFEAVDLKHEVRELCRCTHVFHRDCLDTWVDSGQVTCPLCRSMLLPPRTNLSRCTVDPPLTQPPPNPVGENGPSITG